MVRQSKRNTRRNTKRSRTRRSRSIKRGGGMFDFLSSKSPAQEAEEKRIEDSSKQQLDAVAKKYANNGAGNGAGFGSNMMSNNGAGNGAGFGSNMMSNNNNNQMGQQRSMFGGRRRRSRKH
jgi:hypothetical protein